MVERFPAIEPFQRGMLDVGDRQQIAWEASGNPKGKPAVVVHGGPGSGSAPGWRRLFDPNAYLIVQFDQRGCGRSTPHAGDPTTDLSVNTTFDLLADMERLRAHLGLERWLLCGGSWGVTLALVYAERHPQRVSELILASVTMTRPVEVHWLYHEVGRYFPEQWERFRNGVPEADRDGDLVAAYHRLLNKSTDPTVRERAARAWCRWEDELLSNEEGWQPDPATATRCSGWRSRESWPTTSLITPGWRTGRYCGTPAGWPGFRACWSTAGSTWAVRSTPPGC
jgi:proline iminopeptidase